jgi:dihydrofolate reductase
MQVSIVVAASENNVIGLDNQLPWHLPDDLRFFKRTTSGKPVLMGRNTWDSLGRALPNRLNLVVSSSLNQVPEGVLLFPGLEEAMEYLHKEHYEELFIIGGGKIYESSMKYTDVIYMTRVHTTLDKGTVFFPVFSAEEWELTWEERHERDEKHAYPFTFQKWERKK